MTKKDKTALVEGLKKLSKDFADLAAVLEGTDSKAKVQEAPAQEPASEPAPAPEEAPKPVTFEELRGYLAEKARSGFRAEVKAMLAKYGVEKLSEVDDPDTWAVMMEEAREIGHGSPCVPFRFRQPPLAGLPSQRKALRPGRRPDQRIRHPGQLCA